MAHPDRKRQGSEKGQREHAGTTSEKSDAGMQSKSQGATGRGVQVSRPDGQGEDVRGQAAPGERADAGGPVADTGHDRDAGAGAAGGRHSSAPAVSPASGQARDLEGRGAMADRGLDVSGGGAPRGRRDGG